MAKISICVFAVYIGEDFNLKRIPASSKQVATYKVIPLRILTRAGETITIDRITDIRRQASTKAGGLGDRYTCLATLGEFQREILLYKDNDDWYMEEDF